MPRLIQAGEATAARRRLFWQLVGTDGITPATGEAGGQPQVSIDGGAWAGSGSIGTLTAVGNGRYYADLATTSVATAGVRIESRYKSSNTAECPGDSVDVVSFDPYAAIAAILEDTGTTLPAAIAAVDAVADAILAALSAAGTSVTVAAPVPSNGGVVMLIYGNDYLTADGRQLSWSVTTALTVASAVFVLHSGSTVTSGTYLSLACTVTASDDGYTLSRDLTAAQTTAMGRGKRGYSVVMTTDDGSVITAVRGLVEVS